MMSIMAFGAYYNSALLCLNPYLFNQGVFMIIVNVFPLKATI